MAAFDFPPTPAVGTLYPLVAEVGKPQYRWNGNEWVAATLDPAGYVRKSGDAMTGALSLAGDPTQALHAVPKQYLDAQRQRISLAGLNQVDITVPATAVAVKTTGLLRFPNASPTPSYFHISVTPGVFKVAAGEYNLNGFYHSPGSALPGMLQYNGNNTFPGMLASGGNAAVNWPVIFDGHITLKRNNTAALFTGDFRATAANTVDVPHYFFHNALLSAGSALSILALRFTSLTGNNWEPESYLLVEWI